MEPLSLFGSYFECYLVLLPINSAACVQPRKREKERETYMASILPLIPISWMQSPAGAVSDWTSPSFCWNIVSSDFDNRSFCPQVNNLRKKTSVYFKFIIFTICQTKTFIHLIILYKINFTKFFILFLFLIFHLNSIQNEKIIFNPLILISLEKKYI